MRKTKKIIGAVVVIAVALAFVLPSSAVVTNIVTKETIDPFWVGKERREIKEVKTWSKESMSLPLLLGDDVQISGWAEGDDRRPAITKTSDGAAFVTYQHDEDIFASSAGFAYALDTSDQEAWFNSGVILSLQGVEIIYYPDTATCDHPDYELMNVFIAIDTEEEGGMYIPDYTDYESWEIYTWTNGAPEPEFAGISDGGWYQDLNYADVIGPYNFYIETSDLCGDLARCPVFFHTGIDAESGVGYYDCQDFEQTAPASDPDYVNMPDRIHTSIYNMDTEKVIWKKIDPTVECDYEYTPFQATVADGTNPSIAAYGTQVAIVYAHEGNIKCVYSSDDGETWSQPVTIGPGGFPDVYAVGSTLYAGYVNNGNLYMVTSENGGATWSSPSQPINSVDGSVVEEENCIDVHSAGIVWVDDRNGAFNIFYAQLPGSGSAPTTPTATYNQQNDELAVSSTDADGDQIRYGVSWDNDQTVDKWTGFSDSGVEVKIDCEGNKGPVGVIAEDSNGLQSGWVKVTPRSKSVVFYPLLSELFPRLYQLLQILL